MRLTVWIFVAVTIVLGVVLFQVKYRVAGYGTELSALHKAIREGREAIKVIRAEWSYLREPQRLQELSDKFLQLKPIQTQQMVTLEEIEKAVEEEASAHHPAFALGGGQ